MNLILFESTELDAPLPRRDPRAVHIIDVLRRSAGGTFDAGVINGARGKGTLVRVGDNALTLNFVWGNPPPPPFPITLIVGLPRPQTARDILRDATTLGVEAMHFVTTDRCDPNYARSNLWSGGEWRRLLITGAQQAFCTRVPVVMSGHSLSDTLATLPPTGTRFALDNYESPIPLGKAPAFINGAILAVGPERGWSGVERTQLRAHRFGFVHLGERVLRTETACVVAITLLRGRLGLM